MAKRIFKGVEILEEDRLVDKPIMDEKYHVSWASSGCVWKFTGFDAGGMALLETPKTRKHIRTVVDSLRHINRNAYKNAKKRIKSNPDKYCQCTKEPKWKVSGKCVTCGKK